MSNSFKFHVAGENTAEQTLVFVPSQGDKVEIPIPDMGLPTDVAARFQVLYAILFSRGLVEPENPTFNL